MEILNQTKYVYDIYKNIKSYIFIILDNNMTLKL
jgi:hypothetical protein